MKYTAIRNNIQSGDVFAFRGRGPLKRLIRSWTGGSYSHIGIAWVFKNRNFILQAREGYGIEITALSEMIPCDWIKTNTDWTDDVETYAMSHLGQSYSYLNAIRAGVGLSPVGAKTICSEYAASILKYAKVIEEKQSILTPVDLVNHLLDLGKSLQIVNKV